MNRDEAIEVLDEEEVLKNVYTHREFTDKEERLIQNKMNEEKPKEAKIYGDPVVIMQN